MASLSQWSYSGHVPSKLFQAQFSYIVAVTSMGLGIGDELTATIPTAVVLLSMPETVL
jgi:hypothetical protein